MFFKISFSTSFIDLCYKQNVNLMEELIKRNVASRVNVEKSLFRSLMFTPLSIAPKLSHKCLICFHHLGLKLDFGSRHTSCLNDNTVIHCCPSNQAKGCLTVICREIQHNCTGKRLSIMDHPFLITLTE